MLFVSHCLLNANTRFLGGAARPGAVTELVEQCLQRGLGIVQLPCPEQLVWGGVLKPRLLWLLERPPGVRRALLPLALAYTRLRYRRLARAVAGQAADCTAAGVEVVALVGVDGSPSCGAAVTLDARAALLGDVQLDRQADLVRRFARSGRGIFIDELVRALERRGLHVPLVAHDLVAELEGRPAALRLP